jgi:hypothetical protein
LTEKPYTGTDLEGENNYSPKNRGIWSFAGIICRICGIHRMADFFLIDA